MRALDERPLDVRTFEVRLFGRYRDLADGPILRLDVPEECTVAELVKALHRQAPGNLPARPLVAVNHRPAADGERILAGDEIALIPPVAGG